MWSAVAPVDVESPAPSARSKHSATLVGEHVYVLGGRNGNLPMKDFWKYNLVTGKWQQLKPTGDKLPSLQEHSAVAHRDGLYIFGGEVGFSAGTETPLWHYDIKNNCWKKVRTKKGVVTPKGRRGHTALVHRASMLIYGGYQDLRGSCSELWAFHFETESWHLLSSSPVKNNSPDFLPPPRHKHSAIIHDDCLWIYGGMTDLQERGDLWKWDTMSKNWTNIKCKINPGTLHSHAACKLPSSMLIFGGERGGHPLNELWKFNFSVETWEKITISGAKPQPRSESVAFTVSELVLNGHNSLQSKQVRIRARTCTSADRGNRHSSYLPNNRVAPCEKTYVFQPTQTNYTDGSDLAQQYSDKNNAGRSFIQEITKISQMNISRLNNKCSYTVLTGCQTDSTESLLRQHASPPGEEFVIETEISTPSRGTMVKSRSAYVIKKKYQTEDEAPVVRKKVEFDCSSTKKITREPISVPNFSTLTLATPVLTPVEAAKLVYLDTDDENDLINDSDNILEVKPNCNNLNFENNITRGESYSSHLAYADNPLYQHMINSTSSAVKSSTNLPESSTSDYCSIETMNRLSSASNYSVKTNTPQEENLKNKDKDREGPFGFCNPNYMGPEIKALFDDRKVNGKSLNNNEKSDEEEMLELQEFNGGINRNSKVYFRNSVRSRPPKSLNLENGKAEAKSRALSAGRADRSRGNNKSDDFEKVLEPFVPLYVYVVGGKEQGQVTVFQRPISIWKLKLF